jgi:rubrerythrin
MQSTIPVLLPCTPAAWVEYFKANRAALLEIPWHNGPELTERERRPIERSLQEFQRGEQSEGHHFFRYAQQYVARTGDGDYLVALRLFIAEEQRHARELGRFLTLNGIPLVERTFADSVFRGLRHVLGALEISIAVLLTAEIIAQVYYPALKDATRSAVLRRICDQIIQDEERHVQFQSQQLARLRAGRGRLFLACAMAAQTTLFAGTCLVVWFVHAPAFKAGGYGFGRFWRTAWLHFRSAFAPGA